MCMEKINTIIEFLNQEGKQSPKINSIKEFFQKNGRLTIHQINFIDKIYYKRENIYKMILNNQL